MNITTVFDIGQVIWSARTERKMETRDCPVCNGRGKVSVSGDDGRKYDVTCPNASFNVTEGRCRYGKVDVAMQYEALPPQRLTVGQVRLEIGGLGETESGFSNVGTHDEQTFKRDESVMCYETGIGSGSVYRVGSDHPYPHRLFATFEEADEWGEAEAARLNAEDAEAKP